jgi:hypothetical protein
MCLRRPYCVQRFQVKSINNYPIKTPILNIAELLPLISTRANLFG